MKKFLPVAITAMLAGYVNVVVAADQSDNQINDWSRTEKDQVENLCFKQSGRELFSKLILDVAQEGRLAQYFNATSFVSTANEGSQSLSCLIKKTNDVDRLALAKLAAQNLDKFNYDGLVFLGDMVVNFPGMREPLYKPTVENLPTLLGLSSGRDFVSKFFEVDQEFAVAVADMQLDIFRRVVKLTAGEPVSRVLENLTKKYPDLQAKFIELFAADLSFETFDSLIGRNFFCHLMTHERKAACVVTNFSKDVITTLLGLTIGKELIQQALTIAFSQEDFFTYFHRNEMVIDVINNFDGLNVLLRLVEIESTNKSMRDFAYEYFASLITQNGMKFVTKLVKEKQIAEEFFVRAGYRLSEIAKLKEGRAFIITLAKFPDIAFKIAQNVDVAAMLSQNIVYAEGINGLDVMRELCKYSPKAVEFFKNKFSDQFSTDFKAIKDLPGAKTFMQLLDQ